LLTEIEKCLQTRTKDRGQFSWNWSWGTDRFYSSVFNINSQKISWTTAQQDVIWH